MQKLYVLILFLFVSRLISAQTTYSHDASGNRIKRLYSSSPLPVTLISFTATKEGTMALLDWQTSFETNSDRFDIYRSQDGKKWINIGYVIANGENKTISSYSFSDKSPMDGENLYRLKMSDKDGTFSFSRIQSLNFDGQISFYPNPVNDLLKINGIPTGTSATETVQLFNTSGKSVLNLGNIPANGIDMSGLPTGVYLVKIALKNGTSIIGKVFKK